MPISKQDEKDLNEVFPPEEDLAKDGWVKTGGGDEEAWDFEQNPVLQGLYIEVRRNVGDNNSNFYIIEDAKTNTRVGMWGSTVIDARFFTDTNEPRIATGSEVRIEYNLRPRVPAATILHPGLALSRRRCHRPAAAGTPIPGRPSHRGNSDACPRRARNPLDCFR